MQRIETNIQPYIIVVGPTQHEINTCFLLTMYCTIHLRL